MPETVYKQETLGQKRLNRLKLGILIIFRCGIRAKHYLQYNRGSFGLQPKRLLGKDYMILLMLSSSN